MHVTRSSLFLDIVRVAASGPEHAKRPFFGNW